MKKILKIIGSIVLMILVASSTFAYQGQNFKGKGYGNNQNGQVYQIYDDTQIDYHAQIETLPKEDLSDIEASGLIFMREEEKLARDVYLKLYELWGQQIFSNIANSEQTHTDSVKSLLDKYELEDPVENDEVGVFENEDLQKLYDDLVEKGSNSLLDALIVGATIEDLDIHDLIEFKLTVDNEDITLVYDNLEKGSRNHLRSFVKSIESNGGTYEPQYISEDYYNEIINSDMETGQKNNNSNSNSNINSNNQNKINSNQNSNNINNNQNTNNPNAVWENTNQEESRNMFVRMWRGFKNWF